jgi:hypothetical protein
MITGEKISASEYHAGICPEPELSTGIIKHLINRTPYHAWLSHPKLNKSIKHMVSTEFDLGTAAHSMLLENDSSNIVVLRPENHLAKNGNVPKGYTNDAIRAARDDARASGKIPVLEDDFMNVRYMIEQAKKFIAGSEIAKEWIYGKPELSFTRKLDCGTWIKTRPDFLTDDHKVIIDYKTTANGANPEQFVKQIFSLSYDVQASLYSYMNELVYGIRPTFLFLVQSTEPPFECSLVGASASMIAVGMEKMKYAIQLWKKCLDTNAWPSYPGVIHWAEAPAYAISAIEEKLCLADSLEQFQI